jgi:hypothetical protein
MWTSETEEVRVIDFGDAEDVRELGRVHPFVEGFVRGAERQWNPDYY